MLRSASHIGCAHCTSLDADRACPLCTRIICSSCAADWTTCNEPIGRSLQLGAGSRVHDIDPDGRLAIVSRHGKVRALDLRTLRYQPIKGLHRGMFTDDRRIGPRLISSRSLVYADLDRLAKRTYYRGLTAISLDTAKVTAIDTRVDIIPATPLAISATGDYIAYVSEEQTIHVATAGAPPRAYASRLRARIEALCVDAARKCVAIAARDELALDVMTADKVLAGGHVTLEPARDVVWLALADNVLAVASCDARETHVQVRSVNETLSIGPVAHGFAAEGRFGAASLSRDGRYLAIGIADRLYVLNTETGERGACLGDGAQITAVQFSDRHALIAADSDGTIHVWPRGEAGYTAPLVATDV